MIADLVITVAYFSIPLQIVFSLYQYPRLAEKTLQTKKIAILLVLFALFIFLCGTGHLLRTMNKGDTELFQIVNILTAIISPMTALYLIPFVPNLLITLDQTFIKLTKSRRILNAMYPDLVRDRLLDSIVVGSSYDDDEEISEIIGNNDIELGSINECISRTTSAGSHVEEQEENNSKNHKKNSTKEKGKGKRKNLHRLSSKFDVRRKLRDYILRGQKNPDLSNGMNDNFSPLVMGMSAPIADTIPDVSIMFADMTNFTAWSSKHIPIEVFTLLEKIFGSFDDIALKLGVFKLGTVGDCYIAATGIPESQEDHAVLLATYTERCRQKLKEIITSSAQDYGEDINTIGMRFGIHSGTVTAGVLRGHKSRFELFGDTINTASRMESTGVRDKIQVSEETARLIREGRGEDCVLTLRENPVCAKGKGLMTTYFLSVNLREEKQGNSSLFPIVV